MTPNRKKVINTNKDAELRAIEFEALVNEAQIICIEVQGMKYENEERKVLGQSMAYVEDSFLIMAEKLRKVTENMRNLARL